MPQSEKDEALFAAEEVVEESVVESDESALAEDTFAEKKEEEDKKEVSDDTEKEDDSDDSADDKEDEEDKKEKPEDKSACGDKKKKHTLEAEVELDALRAEMAELQSAFAALQEEAKVLREFKAARDEADKDALIAKYFMLSDEDKADVIAHKSEYSLEDIESKLALIYVQKNVNFDMDSIEETEETPVTSFSLESDVNDTAEDDEFLNVLRTAKNNL